MQSITPAGTLRAPSPAQNNGSPLPGGKSMATPKVYKNFIRGEWVESATGQVFENLNPANRHELLGQFQQSDSRDVDRAVSAAKEAYRTWRLVPAPKRGEILFRAARILHERKEALAEQMTREMGKVMEE